jgi:hypothetical protein
MVMLGVLPCQGILLPSNKPSSGLTLGPDEINIYMVYHNLSAEKSPIAAYSGLNKDMTGRERAKFRQ